MTFSRWDLRYLSRAIDHALLSEEAFVQGYEERRGIKMDAEVRETLRKTKRTMARWRALQQRIWRELI